VTVIVPDASPALVGVNVTSIAQLDPPASVLPQVVVRPKSPLATMPEIVSDPIPLLVRVTV
jgi:hypothetical protein